jgi:hypothetical protein
MGLTLTSEHLGMKCRGGGYYWKYLKDLTKEEVESGYANREFISGISNSKKVFQLNVSNDLIKEWVSVKSINDELNTTCAYGWINTNKFFRNSKWYYEAEYKNISNRSSL